MDQYASGGCYDPFAEFKIRSVTNGVLTEVLAFERQFIELGLNYPFGGSLFVCARKVRHAA